MFIKNRFGHVFEVTEDVGKQMVRRGEWVEVSAPKEEEAPKADETPKAEVDVEPISDAPPTKWKVQLSAKKK